MTQGQMMPPNVEDDWWSIDEWADQWGPPLDVVNGEAERAEAILGLLDEGSGGMRLGNVSLVREPDNTRNPNAIRVEAGEAAIGYIVDELAESLARVLDEAGCPSVVAPALLRAYERGANPQVYIWLDRRVSPGPAFVITGEMRADYFPIGPHGGHILGVVETYWDYRDEITDAWSARDFHRVVEFSKQTFPLLEPVVREVIETRGEFWTSTPPAIEQGASCMAVFGDLEGLNEMEETLTAVAELRQWLPVVSRAREDAALIRRIVDHVRSHPGVLEKDLAPTLVVSKEDVSRVCWMVAASGLLDRHKVGRYNVLDPPSE
jgi:hypothetical protein